MHRILLPLLIACAPVAAQAEDVMVFAAASLKTALDDVAAAFTAETGERVTLSYAGSNTLARQIIEGAPADIFISAASDWMDLIAAEGLLKDDSRIDLLSNSLVLVGPAGAAKVDIDENLDLVGLLDGEKLAMGLVNAVPAGQYGKAALDHLGLWSSVAEDIAQTDNVRAALALVAAGEAALGITYATDAQAESGVAVIGTFPSDSYPQILYPMARLDTGNGDGFYEYLQSDSAVEVFTRHGFDTLTQ